MAKELLPDALWAQIAPLLPPEPPKPKGGRPQGPRNGQEPNGLARTVGLDRRARPLLY